ncbi:MAG: transposase [Pseudomonadota bacterium]
MNLLRQIELSLASGSDVATACLSAGVSDTTYYAWRKKYGGIGKSQLREMKELEKENAQLKKIADHPMKKIDDLLPCNFGTA